MSTLTNQKVLNKIRKSIVLAVLCLCFANAVYAQGGRCHYNNTDVELLNGKTILKSTKQPVNGLVCDYQHINVEAITKRNPNQQAALLELMQRVVDGSMTIEQIVTFQEFLLKEGLLNVAFEVPYKDGKIEGIRRAYYESGKLMGETPYKDDKVEGVLKVYFETGKLNIETPYKNHKREGYERVYYATGQLRAQILYKNDEPISGACGDGGALTNAELINWANGGSVSFLCPL